MNNGGNRRGGKRAIRIQMRKTRGEKTREEEMSGTGEERRSKEEWEKKGRRGLKGGEGVERKRWKK